MPLSFQNIQLRQFFTSKHWYSTKTKFNMGFYDVAPKPESALGYHRVFAPSAGVKVSLLCLGAMDLGSGW